ncbi:MAG: hypothetical protein ACI8ZM_000154 [Crocinitomix sp.]|jgi:hypothetical protein
MIRRITSYKTPLLLTLALLVLHFAQKDFSNPYERPIAGDAQAYYAYLPATFIYGDFSYEFIPEINAKYYPESHQKSFLKPVGDGKVNKTFPGVALLYLPFFLMAHTLALIFGADADGYSNIYQVCFDLGLWTYLFLGLVFFIKVLQKMAISKRIAVWSSLIVLLGTNMVFYSVYDQSVTHIYNFFMINALLYYLIKFKENKQFKPLGVALFLFALIGITRPTNVLVVGLIFFFIPDLKFYKSLFSYCFQAKNIIRIVPILGGVLIIPFILWKVQTGNWVVYSYGDEGFNFSNPHLSEFLFSYLKGWFIYTPLLLLILLVGFYFLFKSNKKRFTIALFFYAMCIYVFSSWWCWYYGAGMGQRVMIDHYILAGFLLAIILQNIQSSTVKKWLFGSFAFLCIGLNFAQAYQIRHGILTGGSATVDQYWDNFLSFEKKAQVYPHEHWVLEELESLTLSPEDPAITKGQSYMVDGIWSVQVSSYDNYSASLESNLKNLRKGSKVSIAFEARARDLIQETRVILDLDGKRQIFTLSPYLKKDEWVKIEYLIEPQELMVNPMLLYFWNGGSEEKVEFKNMQFKHYFSEDYL